MPQSPELAGGAGFTFEGNVAAFYLSTLLAQGAAPGVNNKVVTCVSVQQRDFGEPLDDVIVDFLGLDLSLARLSLQVKSQLTISAATSNADFREVIRDSWHTLKKPNFRLGLDRYGAAVFEISSPKLRDLQALSDLANESATTEHFEARFTCTGNASAAIKNIKTDIVGLLREINGRQLQTHEVQQFLAHLVVIRFDFHANNGASKSNAINLISTCLAATETDKAPLVWARLVQLARQSAARAGQFDRAKLVHEIASVARLRGAVSFQSDLDKLSQLAQSYANDIYDDIGGERLDRNHLIESLDSALKEARLVQIHGLPGTGKSALVKRVVESALKHGPVLFLKAERLEGTGWASFATANGMSNAPFEQLLVELGATGTPVLFIDAIDRIENNHRSIVLDVLRTIVASPLLGNWKVVVSLRDTNIELLHNWLSDILIEMPTSRLEVSLLNETEAEALAMAKPHLRALLFGSEQVRDIVRRPFFAKILNQEAVFRASQSAFEPQSEIDLIERWWRRGGFDSGTQNAIDRQQTLLELAKIKAKHLSEPVRLSELTSHHQIYALKEDGIIQNVREGVSVNFSHDIFFEWSYFYVLADSADRWLEQIKASGEPPALARVVELSSQWSLAKGQSNDWQNQLHRIKSSNLRSQWLRAWLLGPLGNPNFHSFEQGFKQALFDNDFQLFRKLLVWLQAQKTVPNLAVLKSDYPAEKRQRLADLHGLPSDYPLWARLIIFVVKNTSDIPHNLRPEIVTVFEVWQNACANQRNPISHALLTLCDEWLTQLTTHTEPEAYTNQSQRWQGIDDLEELKKSLVQLILRASRSEPQLTDKYVRQVIDSGQIQRETFEVILWYSTFLAQTHPKYLVAVSLAYLLRDLPHAQVDKEQADLARTMAWHTELQQKPPSERTRQDNLLLGFSSVPGLRHEFNDHDWERLCINDDYSSYWPTSPLREPFHSLFQYAPEQALELVKVLCNHAMEAWRQLHRYSSPHTAPYTQRKKATPLALNLVFPWGSQNFWGSDREYQWFRSTWAPKSIACGLMALEDWCFAQLERGIPVDEVIQRIVKGNECIAVLGVASALLLQSQVVSETTLTLVTSQRLLKADFNRMMQDIGLSTANLIGFKPDSDKAHIEAVKRSNARAIRRIELANILPIFVLPKNKLANQSRDKLLAFKDNLPYLYEEDRHNQSIHVILLADANKYAGLADIKNYRLYQNQEKPDLIQVVHVSPSMADTQSIAEAQDASNYLKVSNLWMWADKTFETGKVQDNWTISEAIVFTKKMFDGANTEPSKTGSHEHIDSLMTAQLRLASIAATAAIVLNFRDARSVDELEWARQVVHNAAQVPEQLGAMQSPDSVIPWHHAKFVAHGLAADIRENTGMNSSIRDLLSLVAHPNTGVAELALNQVCLLWDTHPKLSWAALVLALKLCHISQYQYNAAHHTSNELQNAIDEVTEFYKSEKDFMPLPAPPPAWIKIRASESLGLNLRNVRQPHSRHASNDINLDEEEWFEPVGFWHTAQVSKVLACMPIQGILNSAAKDEVLNFLTGALEWTHLKNSPPWAKAGERVDSGSNLYSWNSVLGATLGCLAGLIPLHTFQHRFLAPILEQKGDSCWALLEPFTDTYVRAYVYDAPLMPEDAIALLELCLKRFLSDGVFERNSYRGGELSGYHLPGLARTLMFVQADHAELASRYANGDWSSINHILLIVDRFVRAGGWNASIMSLFLTLCERAKDHYPAVLFADQVLAIVSLDPGSLKGWHDTFNLARIAELIDSFSRRDAKLPPELAQKMLRILDLLVDMGDRRSAALQLSTAFREVSLPN